jgi:uncharacterized membrane protein
MSPDDNEPGPGPRRLPNWARRLMQFGIVFGVGMIAWNVWVVRELVTSAEPHGAGSWVAVVIQTTLGILLIAQGLLFLRAAR